MIIQRQPLLAILLAKLHLVLLAPHLLVTEHVWKAAARLMTIQAQQRVLVTHQVAVTHLAQPAQVER